jgi:carbamate kinase
VAMPLEKKRVFELQYNAIRDSLKKIRNLVKKGFKIVITHGNGPQVGDALLRNETAEKLVPSLPLYACVAGTQGVLGAMIQMALLEIFGEDCKIASLITKVRVSAKDPAFKKPTKPIGRILKKDDIQNIKKTDPLASFVEFTSGKYRRVVPSPKPISILELDVIKKLVVDDYIVISCGGGGIPVTIKKNKIEFTNAVIDKDLTSELLATKIGASMFVILTDVAGVYLNFKSKDKELLKKINAEKIKELLIDGTFEQGSMKPKIIAAVSFVEKTGNKAVIASFRKIKDAVNLKTGTIIYK